MAAVLKRVRGDDLAPFDEVGARLRVLDALFNQMPEFFRDDLAAAAIRVSAETMARSLLRAYEDAARAERVRAQFRPEALVKARAARTGIKAAIRKMELVLSARYAGGIVQSQIDEYVRQNGVIRHHPDALGLDAMLAGLHAEAEKIEHDIRALDGRERPPSRLRLLGGELVGPFLVARPKGLIGIGPAFERFISGSAEFLTGRRIEGQLVNSVSKGLTLYK